VDERQRSVFHHAFPVDDLGAARRFYGDVLRCPSGRRDSDRAVDFDFFGHHVIAHLVEGESLAAHRAAGGPANVQVRHFGAVLPWSDWQALADRLAGEDVEFIVEPHVRHSGHADEEALMLLADPSGNVLEFKAVRDLASFFGHG
jgi:extradiol dioxygenase family protein